jgi:hypothetical protein
LEPFSGLSDSLNEEQVWFIAHLRVHLLFTFFIATLCVSTKVCESLPLLTRTFHVIFGRSENCSWTPDNKQNDRS